jgi:flagellar basal body-associated protein FliL
MPPPKKKGGAGKVILIIFLVLFVVVGGAGAVSLDAWIARRLDAASPRQPGRTPAVARAAARA